MSEIQYWLWLTLKRGITSRKITTLLERFETPEAIFCAEDAAFYDVPELTKADVDALCNRNLKAAKRVMTECREKGIKILTFDSPYYPQTLAQIYDPPYVLYAKYKERIDLNEHMTLAMVGTRKCSDYGLQMAESMARSLAEEGVTIVSGMARGIDGAANTGALRGGGITVAVLGCGVDICYPAEHKRLMEEIIHHGMVLSEYPPGTRPFPGNFKPRNRIVTGLSHGTVIVEAPERSGAINSANWTAEQNREVFVVPGDATRNAAQGSNKLMIEGAKPVVCADDILCEFKERFSVLLEKNRPSLAEHREFDFAPEIVSKGKKPSLKKKRKEQLVKKEIGLSKAIPLSEREEAVLKLLTVEPRHIDELMGRGFSAGELNALLTMLELKGQVVAQSGKRYCLKQDS